MRRSRISMLACQIFKFLNYSNISVGEIAECYHFSKSTIYRAIKRAEDFDGSCVENNDELFFFTKTYNSTIFKEM